MAVKLSRSARIISALLGHATGHILITILFSTAVFADIAVISPDNKSVQLFIDYKISYTPSIPDSGILGYLVLANPPDACTPIQPPPSTPGNRSKLISWFVLAERSTSYHMRCSNRDKIQHATEAGYRAVILYSPSETYFHSLSYFSMERAGSIPAVLVSHEDGELLRKEYRWPTNYKIFITSDLPPNLSYYLLPFAVVIGVCLVLTVSFMIFQLVRCVQERQRVHRHRLPKKFLKKLPLQKFEKGIYFETCAICLDDYIDGERIRILPCNHAYHMKCIDPWLTNNRRVCPVCKGKIRLPGMPESDGSESESDNRRPPNFNTQQQSPENDANTNSTSERSGLLRSSSRSNRARTRPNFGNFFNILNSTGQGRSQAASSIVQPSGYGTIAAGPGSSVRARNEPLDDTFMQPGPSQSSSAPTVSRLAQASHQSRSKRRSRHRNLQVVVTADVTPVIAPTQHSINCDQDYEPLIDWDERQQSSTRSNNNNNTTQGSTTRVETMPDSLDRIV